MAHDMKWFNDLKKKVEALGAEDIVIEQGRKHRKMRFTAHGKRLLYCLSSSPSDCRVQQYILSDCRRMIRNAQLNG